MPAVLFLTADLMFSSRVLGAAKTLGLDCRLIGNPQQVEAIATGDCALALIDLGLTPLDLTATVSVIRAAAPRATIVAYGPHVDEALLAAATEAGCDRVLPRSQFHQQYVALLQGAANAV